MSTAQQPEALRLADKYEVDGFLGDHRFAQNEWCRQAAAELRTQHERIAELEAQLSAIGAGGVEPLRKRAATVSDEQIKMVFLANGFTIKEGLTDLKPYVYQAARALLATGGQAQTDTRDAERIQSLLCRMIDQLERRRKFRSGNAPGHGHGIPGIWDSDNGNLAGKKCEWCEVWQEALEVHAAAQPKNGDTQP